MFAYNRKIARLKILINAIFKENYQVSFITFLYKQTFQPFQLFKPPRGKIHL